MEIQKTATIKVIIILLLSLFLPPDIMSQPSKKGAAKAVKVLFGKNPVGSVLRKGKTRNATSTATQRYGSGIANTNVSKIPSSQAAQVPPKGVGIKEANILNTPSIPLEIIFPPSPINKNNVVEYKPLSSEWDKEWLDLIEHEIERVYHLVPKNIQKEKYKLKIRPTENKTGFVYINYQRYDKEFHYSA